MNINEYQQEQQSFQDESFFDIDFFDGANYVTKKILGSTIKSGIQAGMVDATQYNNDISQINSDINGKLDVPTGGVDQYLNGIGAPTDFPPEKIEKMISMNFGTQIQFADNGTVWNGVSGIRGTPAVTLNQKYRMLQFMGAGNQNRKGGAYINANLPSYYIQDNEIIVEFVWTSDDAGDVFWSVGLTKPNSGGFFGYDSETTWKEFTIGSTGGFKIIKTTVAFDGSGLNVGDPITVQIFRDFTNPNDTLENDAYLNTVKIEQK